MLKIEPVAPDWPGLLANLRRQGTPRRPFYFEHGVDAVIKRGVAERHGLWDRFSGSAPEANLQRDLAVHRHLGHELFRIFPAGARFEVAKRRGGWAETGTGPIGNWADFEAYPWPSPAAADLNGLELLERLTPPDMRAFLVTSVWEAVRDLFGYEQFCQVLYEDEELVAAVFDKVGGFVVAVTTALCDFSNFGALYVADDLGYKTGLMLSPAHFRQYVMPWHRRLAEIAHARGKLFLLHSCGQVYDLIDDWIDVAQIDAKHSFEDVILPVEGAKERYGKRLALLGGMDVDFLARAAPEQIRARTRKMLSACLPGGGYCLGSGNWVTDYIPLDNYLAMLDESRRQ